MNKHFLFVLASAVFVLAVFINISAARSPKESSPYTVDSACSVTNATGEIDLTEKIAQFEGRMMNIPNQAVLANAGGTEVLGVASEERWIEVDLSEQKLKAWEGNTLFLETAISSGLPATKTPEGEFRIWTKLRATKMEGGRGKYYYYLPNVPYVMFFENTKVPGWKGYGLHGTYWHNDFGNPRSHGCVNLPTEIAKQIYEWTSPIVPEGKWMAKATADNPGTRIVIHQ